MALDIIYYILQNITLKKILKFSLCGTKNLSLKNFTKHVCIYYITLQSHVNL